MDHQAGSPDQVTVRLRAPWMALLFACIALPSCAQERGGPPPGPRDPGERFAKEKANRAEVLVKERAKVLAAIDDRRDGESEAGALLQLAAERLAFEKSEILPACAPQAAIRFEAERARLARVVEGACQAAIDEYTKSAQHDRARELTAELAKLQDAHEPLSWEDLRCRVDVARDAAKGGWRWKGTSLLADSGKRSLLCLAAKALPAAYELRIDAARLSGTGDLQLVFRQGDAKKARQGLLILGGLGGKTHGLELVDGRSICDNNTEWEEPIFEDAKTVDLRLLSEAQCVRVRVGNSPSDLIKVTGECRLSLPEGLRPEADRGDRLYLIASGNAVFRVDSILLRTVLEREPVYAKQTPPRPPEAKPGFLPRGSEWKGMWDKAECRVIVEESTDKSAILSVREEPGAWYRFECKIERDRIKVIHIEHTKPASPGGRLRKLTEESGGGSFSEKVLRINFTSRSELPRKKTDFGGEIIVNRL